MFLNTENHISLDLETLGTEGSPVILSIGAVRFSPDRDVIPVGRDLFYRTITIGSSIRKGLTIDGETLHWWMTQHPSAIAAAFAGENSIGQALHEFFTWSTMKEPEVEYRDGYLWGFSAAFDCSHLETACRHSNVGMAFDFRHQLCARTIAKAAFPEGIKYEDYQSADYPNHHALGDAIRQARIIRASLQRLGVTR